MVPYGTKQRIKQHQAQLHPAGPLCPHVAHPHLTPGPGGRMRLPAVALSWAAAASELQATARVGAGLM